MSNCVNVCLSNSVTVCLSDSVPVCHQYYVLCLPVTSQGRAGEDQSWRISYTDWSKWWAANALH